LGHTGQYVPKWRSSSCEKHFLSPLLHEGFISMGVHGTLFYRSIRHYQKIVIWREFTANIMVWVLIIRGVSVPILDLDPTILTDDFVIFPTTPREILGQYLKIWHDLSLQHPPNSTIHVGHLKSCGLAAVRRCYAEGGGDLCQVVVVGVT
jgi:hypothetical protein